MFIWRVPAILINNIPVKINSIQKPISNNQNKSKRNWKKFLYLFKYISIGIEYLQIEYENSNILFQRIPIHPTNTFNSTNSDMRINCEYVDLSITDNSEEFSRDNSSLLLLKSTWNSIEIQTNLDQRLLINGNHWTFEINHKIIDYFKRNQSLKHASHNFFTVIQSTSSNDIFNKFDRWLEYLHDPFIDISIRHINVNYISINHTSHHYTHNNAHLSLNNSSKLSAETRHVYNADFRLRSHSTFLIHGLCQLTVFPVCVDIAWQFNEFVIQLREDTIQQFHHLLSSRSSSSTDRNSWKCDREIDISFQFVNPSIHLKMIDIHDWFIWQLNFCKITFHYNQNIETKSIIELKCMLIYTSDTNRYPPSQSFIDNLNKKDFRNCLYYLPNADITVRKDKKLHIQFDITEIRLQTNEKLLTLFKRLQR